MPQLQSDESPSVPAADSTCTQRQDMHHADGREANDYYSVLKSCSMLMLTATQVLSNIEMCITCQHQPDCLQPHTEQQAVGG